jgi:hypothetical protein
MSSTSLVTNGYICYGKVRLIPVPSPATCESPDMVSAIEIRPRIRTVVEDEEFDGAPVMTSVQELKPQMKSSQAEPDPPPDVDPPTNTSAQELKPVMISAEEDD